MKKSLLRIISTLLIVTLLSGCLAGCSLSGDDLSGTEKAKLLLANTRLDSTLLQSSLNMVQNPGAPTASLILPNEDMYATLGGIKLPILSTLGSCTVNGNTYEWKMSEDYCNIDSFFDSYMVSIESSVEQAAEAIDDMKEHVKVIDKWTGSDEKNATMLSVDGSTDILYTRSEGYYSICKRTTNDKAENVYEMYYFGDTSTGVPEDVHQRSLYIPGKRYEFSLDMGSQMNLYMVLEKINGQWNMLCMSVMDSHVNVTNLVTASDITYVYDYMVPKNTSEPLTSFLSLATANQGCDLIRVQDNWFTLYSHGCSGIKSMKVTASANDIAASDGTYSTFGTVIPSIVLSNGSTIEPSQTFANGTVSYFAGNAGYCADGYILSADFSIEGDDINTRLDNYQKFLSETGIDHKVRFSTLRGYILKGQQQLDSFLGSCKWNGYTINNYSNIVKGTNVEKDSYNTFASMYDKVKDNEFVAQPLFQQNPLNGVDFTKIDTFNKGTLTWNNDAKTVSVVDMSMTISDMTLLEAGTQYTIILAYAQKDKEDASQYDPCTICPLYSENYVFTTYSEGDSFTLTQTAEFGANVEFDTTDFDLVTCIVTEEGIRVSEIIAVE